MSECFICMCDDEDEKTTLHMTNCGCSPVVHTVCLLEWYTGGGADGRDICPVCRTEGRIADLPSLMQRFVTMPTSDTPYYQVPDTPDDVRVVIQPTTTVVNDTQRGTSGQASNQSMEQAVERERLLEKRRKQAMAGIILFIMFIVLLINLRGGS